MRCKGTPFFSTLQILQRLFYEILLYKDFLEYLYAFFHLLLGVGCHERKSHECVLRCTGGWDDRIDEDSIIESQFGDEEGLVDIPHIERNDGAFGITNLEAFLTEAFQGVVGGFPKFLHPLWLGTDNV